MRLDERQSLEGGATDEFGKKVAIISGTKEYPLRAPFSPPQNYPEYPFHPAEIDEDNLVYPMVRELLRKLELDLANYSSETWNPLGSLIKPKDKVVIKPNYVRHFYFSRFLKDGTLSVVTHGAILRPIIDYVYIALKGKGEVVIADAPLADADFDKIVTLTGIKDVVNYYNRKSDGFKVNLLDLRQERIVYKWGIFPKQIKLKGDPAGYLDVDLGEYSQFNDVSPDKLCGPWFNRSRTIKAHRNGVNKNLISATVLGADVVISVPKLKVHRKAGVTLNLKNMIGVSGDKDLIPHLRIGSPAQGGDEFSESKFLANINQRIADKLLGENWRMGIYPFLLWYHPYLLISRLATRKRVFMGGNWYGNDTIWREILDLNRILLYADKEGKLRPNVQRKFFCIIDGIIGGEKEGPLIPLPKECGVLIGGFDPLAVDLVATRLMGFDYKKIPQFENLVGNIGGSQKYPLGMPDTSQVKVVSNIPEWQGLMDNNFDKILSFAPPKGWIGHVEI